MSRVKEFREKLGWTQQKLADNSEVSLRMINRIEKTGKISYNQAVKIAEEFGIDPMYLMGSSEYPSDWHHFIPYLRKFRELLGLSAEEVAEEICVKPAFILESEEGKQWGGLETGSLLIFYFNKILAGSWLSTDSKDENIVPADDKNAFIAVLEEAEKRGKDLSHSERVRAAKLLHMAIDVLAEAEEADRSDESVSNGAVAS